MDKYKYAGKKLKVKTGVGIGVSSFGTPLEGEKFIAEDYWINLTGRTLWNENGNPACMEYAIRTATQKFKVPDFDDNVVYGKVGGYGHLFHETELEPIEGEKEDEGNN